MILSWKVKKVTHFKTKIHKISFHEVSLIHKIDQVAQIVPNAVSVATLFSSEARKPPFPPPSIPPFLSATKLFCYATKNPTKRRRLISSVTVCSPCVLWVLPGGSGDQGYTCTHGWYDLYLQSQKTCHLKRKSHTWYHCWFNLRSNTHCLLTYAYQDWRQNKGSGHPSCFSPWIWLQ